MNDAVAVLANGMLAAILAVSGVFKLADREQSLRGLDSLRLPAPLRSAGFAAAWATVELAVAAGLVGVPAPLSLLVSVLAIAMFAGYVIVVIRASRFGEAVHCHCFGRLDTAPIGPATIARNSGLLLLAVIGAVGAQRGSILQLAGGLSPADAGLLQLGLFLTGGIAVLLLMRRLGNRPSEVRPESVIELGSHRLPDLFGADHDVRRFVGEERSILVFLSETCAACAALAEELPSWRAELADQGIRLRAITTSPPSRALRSFPRLGSYLHQDADGALATALGIASLPAAVYVGADGSPTVTDGPAHGPHAVSILIDNARAATAGEPGRERGKARSL